MNIHIDAYKVAYHNLFNLSCIADDEQYSIRCEQPDIAISFRSGILGFQVFLIII